MGKSVACQLAAKGANVVIVARTTSKLESALETIKVSSPILTLAAMPGMLILSPGFRCTPLPPAIPLHQCRPDESHGLQAYY